MANNKNSVKGQKQRRPSHRTQWAAQFAVASELCKRGYEVAFTMGNHPMKDFMVISPTNVSFVVDVKGLYKRNVWPVHERPAQQSLFYVLAFVPDDKPNEFFILTQAAANQGVQEEFAHTTARKQAKGEVVNASEYFHGIEWNFALRFKDAWANLPQ